MKRTLGTFAAALAAFALTTPALAGTYVVDAGHSVVSFKVKHLGISNVLGTFEKFDGTFEYDAQANTATLATATIEAASVNTKDEKRDGHLKSADFFDVEKSPQITFASTSISPIKENRFTVKGNLTIRGITKPVTLNGTFNGLASDPWGNDRAAFSATGTINRTDYGITWNKTLDKGGLLVGNEVTLSIDVEGILKKDAGTK
jgi:polyisoprenoid-binding protein YceI